MKKNITQWVGIMLLMLLIVSCKKEDGEGGTKAVFSYVADGFVVNFTNFSTGATEYIWDFGDEREKHQPGDRRNMYTKPKENISCL